MQIANVNREESENLHISQVQDGGRPLEIENLQYLRNPSTNRNEICKNMQIVNRAESENFA